MSCDLSLLYEYIPTNNKLNIIFITDRNHSTDLVKEMRRVVFQLSDCMDKADNTALALLRNNYQLKTKQITTKCWLSPQYK